MNPQLHQQIDNGPFYKGLIGMATGIGGLGFSITMADVEIVLRVVVLGLTAISIGITIWSALKKKT